MLYDGAFCMPKMVVFLDCAVIFRGFVFDRIGEMPASVALLGDFMIGVGDFCGVFFPSI